MRNHWENTKKLKDILKINGIGREKLVTFNSFLTAKIAIKLEFSG